MQQKEKSILKHTMGKCLSKKGSNLISRGKKLILRLRSGLMVSEVELLILRLRSGLMVSEVEPLTLPTLLLD